METEEDIVKLMVPMLVNHNYRASCIVCVDQDSRLTHTGAIVYLNIAISFSHHFSPLYRAVNTPNRKKMLCRVIY